MASKIPATTIRIEPEVRERAGEILDELGITIREGGLPFDMKVGSKADGEE